MSPSCPSFPDGHYVVWHVPFLPMFPDTSEEFSLRVSQPSCELQQLLGYKNPGRLRRGAISFHTECTAGTEPSCQPILSPFPQLQICKAQLGLLSREGRVTWGRRGKAKVISHSHAAGLGFLGLVFQSIWKRTTFSPGKLAPGLRPRPNP